MKNSESNLTRQSNKLKVVKRRIKFLFVAPDLKVAKAVLEKEPNEVITAISNAVINARQGVVDIPQHLLPFLGIITIILIGCVTVESQFPVSDTWSFKQMVLFLKLYHFWLRCLALLVGVYFEAIAQKWLIVLPRIFWMSRQSLIVFNNGSSAIIHQNYKWWVAC